MKNEKVEMSHNYFSIWNRCCVYVIESLIYARNMIEYEMEVNNARTVFMGPVMKVSSLWSHGGKKVL